MRIDLSNPSHLPTCTCLMEILIYDKSFMLTIVSVLIGVLIIAYWHFVRYDEDAIQYEVPLPEQCSPSWEGQILDIPSIKVILAHGSPKKRLSDG